MRDGMPTFVRSSEASKTAASGTAPGGADGDPPEAEDSDERLMLAFSEGRQAAFNDLFARYRQPLFGFFRRRVAEPAQAEELTQETFLAVLRTSHRYQPSASFRTYLYAIGFRILRAHRRKAAFRAMFFGTADGPREPSMENSIVADVMIRQAVGRLEHWDREILLLREYEQLSYAEIAEVLTMPVNTVRSRLFRARLALREILTTPIRHPAAAPAEFEERI